MNATLSSEEKSLMSVLTKSTDRISATEARVHFGEIYRRVTENDETIIVERNGKPGAVILSFDAYRALSDSRTDMGGATETEMPNWYSAMVEAATDYREAHKGESMPDAVELVRASREERDAELLDRLS
jgi:prevent-host-death family protein